MPTNTVIPTAAFAGQYYPLPNRPKNNHSATVKRIEAIYESDFGALLDGLSSRVSNENASFGIEDTLDLSPAAQGYIDFANNVASGLVANEVEAGFVLTDAQRAQISAIITKYKDAPFSANTYSKIIRDLGEVGLAPAQLSAQEASNPLTLSQIFLRALGEQSRNEFPTFSNSADKASEAAYISLIVGEWQRMSSNFNPFVVATFVENPYAYTRRKPHE